MREAVNTAVAAAFLVPYARRKVLLTAALGAGIVNAILAIGVFNVPVFAIVSRPSRRRYGRWM